MKQIPRPKPFTPEDRTPAQKRRARWAMFAIFPLVIGLLLFMQFRERFVFRYAAPYMTFSLWSLILFSPFIHYWMKRRHAEAELARKYPTNWVRKGIVMPLMAAMTVGVVLAAPLGWLYAAVAWSGAATEHLNATAIEVGNYTRGKGCDQYATLRLAAVDNKTCLDGLYPPSAMRPGQRLDVGARMTSFGFLIVSIAEAAPAP
jgi:hypothetical protein